MKHISPIPPLLNRRRLLGRLALGGTAALALAACGGGGGSDGESDLDLRAAYDRVLEGMNHEEVNKAVGGAPLQLNDWTRNWKSGNEYLDVNFATLSSGEFYVVGVSWWKIGGGELTKTFDINNR